MNHFPDTSGQIVAGMMAHDAFSQWLGIEVLTTAPGQATCRMTVRSEMTNGFGVCHGGITFAFADSAFAFASNSHGQIAYSVDASMHYPVRVEVGHQLTATARELSLAGPLAHYEVVVSNQEGVAVGIFRGTVYRTRKTHPGVISPSQETKGEPHE